MSLRPFQISTHVLDTNKGRPVTDLPVKIYKLINDTTWILVTDGKTTATGRFVHEFSNTSEIPALTSTGTYKLNFDVKQYYHSQNSKCMYPFIDITFEVDKEEHYHVPLLLNAYGFTTYRGS